MRLWDIALFFMILNIFGTIFTDQLDLPSKVYLDMPENVTDVEQELNTAGMKDSEVTGTDPLTNALGWFYNMIRTKAEAVFNPIKKYVLFSAVVLMVFDVPPVIAYGFASIFLIIQIIGILQFITGRSFKEAE